MKYHGKTCKTQEQRARKDGSGYYKCPKFGEAIKEYGWSNFKYEVLEDGLTKEEAEVREQYWIEKENSIWPNGYNLESGGTFGHKVHEESRLKSSQSQLNDHRKSKKVYQYSKSGQLIDVFPSIHEAERKTGVDRAQISRCCRGTFKDKSAGGSIWKYA